MKKTIIAFFALMLTGSTFAQGNNNDSSTSAEKKRSDFGVAVGVSASTNGIGGNVAIALNKFLAVRAGYEKLDYTYTDGLTLTQSDRSFIATPTMRTGGLSAMLDLYLLKGFYITGGAVLTDFNPSVLIKSASGISIGSITYEPDDLGSLTLAIKPEKKMAPYVGFGFGRNISRNHHLCMSFELGAYHMGSYVVDLAGTNLFEGNNQSTVADLNNTLKSISWSGVYPVIKLGISYRLF